MLSLKLFGMPCLTQDQRIVGGRVVRGPQLALLALLAATDDRPLSRDRVIGLLWPDHDGDRARRLLSQTVYLIRGELGADVVLGIGNGLKLNPARVRCDVQDFLHAVANGDHRGAIDHYEGPFLDGFFLRGSCEFERWLDGERDRLARQYARAAEAVAQQAEASAGPAAAVEWWRRLAEHDPYSGLYALRLMQALHAAGDRAAAIQHAAVQERLLRTELDADPDPTVQELARRLRSEGSQPPEGIAPGPVARAHYVASVETAAPPRATVPLQPPGPASDDRAERGSTRGRILPILAVTGLIVALLLAGIALVPQPGAPAGPEAATIAVLPFVNTNGDPATDYFADGIHEDLLVRLSRIGSLRVISRTSVQPYRNEGRNLRRIARDLNTRYVVVGSVRREGEHVLITAQLIDAVTDHHLWADQYQAEMADIFAVQAMIAQRIADALRLTLTPAEQRRTEAPPTGSLTAYDVYLQALAYGHLYRAADHATAMGLLRQAIALDSTFALAHARLATGLVVAVEMFGGDRDWLDSALVSARRAVTLDPGLPEAYYALGTAYLALTDYERAEPALETAIELQPSFASPATNLGALHGRLGRYDLAVHWHRRAARLDPRGVMNMASLGWIYGILGLFAEAEELNARALTLLPESPVVHRHATLLSIRQGDPEEAVRRSDHFLSIQPDDPRALAVAGHARLFAGDVVGARDALERAYARSPGSAWVAPVRLTLAHALRATGDSARGITLVEEYLEHARAELNAGRRDAILHYGLAVAHTALGDRTEALHWLDTILGHGAGLDRIGLDDPLVEGLHGDPDFDRIRADAARRVAAMRRQVEREAGSR
jgi:TolB-like protein/DNA-binding SARP family transcriptional activator/Flp pilus assembly protein TadD